MVKFFVLFFSTFVFVPNFSFCQFWELSPDFESTESPYPKSLLIELIEAQCADYEVRGPEALSCLIQMEYYLNWYPNKTDPFYLEQYEDMIAKMQEYNQFMFEQHTAFMDRVLQSIDYTLNEEGYNYERCQEAIKRYDTFYDINIYENLDSTATLIELKNTEYQKWCQHCFDWIENNREEYLRQKSEYEKKELDMPQQNNHHH